MVKTFEKITYNLTEEELHLIDILIRGFKNRIGKENAIKGPEIVMNINKKQLQYGLKKQLTEARLRKLTNVIRTNGLLPLIATSDGYYMASSKQDVKDQIQSLYDRAEAIIKAAVGLEQFLVSNCKNIEISNYIKNKDNG